MSLTAAALSAMLASGSCKSAVEEPKTDKDVKTAFKCFEKAEAWIEENQTPENLLAAVEVRSELSARRRAAVKAMLKTAGWPKTSVIGRRAADELVEEVLLARHDGELQLAALKPMEAAVKAKEAEPRHYARLHDLLHFAVNGKQSFGTQGRCGEDGRWIPGALAHERFDVDRMRKGFGLGPLEREIEERSRGCRKP